VTYATSSSTRTWTSVRKNWMYGVLAKIIAHARIISE
jgi:hypothetical protein